MNKVGVLTREDLAGSTPVMSDVPRSAPRAIKVLLPVWGSRYVRQFLENGLPTLLAPGNVPTLAAALPTEFVILTSVGDEAAIREHPAFRRLSATSDTTIRPIDHLITEGNHSTTITIAYAESVLAAGAAMLDTCFFFLVSDYIVADGSLANALKRMQRGISSVVVGNLQVAREDALPWLEHRIAGNELSLALPPREMMRWALDNLHPASLANTVNIPFGHNSHTNRLFWRVDGNTIQGRFYLMHMLCVRPEITNFIIGASCDYSFVPEMCPSGKVEAITDSDEYLVVEMQPREHESAFLRVGPVDPRTVGRSLNDWATKVHRDNARYPIIFHAEELPPSLDHSVEQADVFLGQIARHLTRKPLPPRGHPYWDGAMAAFNAAAGSKLGERGWLYGVDLRANSPGFAARLLSRSRHAVMGRTPRVRPWHPFWPDLKTILDEIEPFCTDHSVRVLMLSNEPTPISKVFGESGGYVHKIALSQFLSTPSKRYEPLLAAFDICFIEIVDADLTQLLKLTDRIMPLMNGSGRIVVSMPTPGALTGTWDFVRGVRGQMNLAARLIRSGAVLTSIRHVPAGDVRCMIYRAMLYLNTRITKGGWLGVPLAIAGGSVLLCLSLLANLDTLRRSRRAVPPGLCSSVVIRLDVDVVRSANRSLDDVAHIESGRNEGSSTCAGEVLTDAIEQAREAS
jgi:hypothetical protein